MRRQTGHILLPTRRRIDVAKLARTCRPPWRPWARGALARAERTADGRIHLVVVRASRGGVEVRVTGVNARQTQILAPIAARVYRAIGPSLGPGRSLRGTSAFEDAVLAMLADDPAARRRLLALERGCPSAPALRVFPDAGTLASLSPTTLARIAGGRDRGRRLHALARAFVALAPSAPRTS
ncbi:MAG: hypothetical protein ACREQL_14440 [Candidatus Binatia bacterium]